jgi:hypothetical protein
MRSNAVREPWSNGPVEGLINRLKMLRRQRYGRAGSSSSVRDVATHNEHGKPFRWTKTADEILDKLRRFGVRTQQVHGQ